MKVIVQKNWGIIMSTFYYLLSASLGQLVRMPALQ